MKTKKIKKNATEEFKKKLSSKIMFKNYQGNFKKNVNYLKDK